MKTSLIIISFITCFYIAKAQVADKSKQVSEDTIIYNAVDQQPEFPGGVAELWKYFEKVTAVYDDNENFQASFLFEMIIEKDGSVTNVKELKRIPNTASGKAIIKFLLASPKWKPGLQNGKPVRVKYSIPLNF